MQTVPRTDSGHPSGVIRIAVGTAAGVLLAVGILAIVSSAVSQRRAAQADVAQLERSRIDLARTVVGELLPTVLSQYQMEWQRFPTTEEGLRVLVAAPGRKGGYLDDPQTIIDPWGHPYRYRSPGRGGPDTYDLSSDGPDGVAGTADDVTN